MPYNPNIHHRHSIRLKEYDYTQPGGYFVTLVTYQRQNIFGTVANDAVTLSLAGQCVQARLLAIPRHFPVQLDQWVILPNHLHAILFIEDGERRASLPAIIQNFKSLTSRQINSARGLSEPVWQKNYYEHIIRQDRELDMIRQYILDNPRKWTEDTEYRSE